jgi:hypothetical protein
MYEKLVNQVMFACKNVSETSLYKTLWAQGHITVVVNLDGGLSQRQ